MSVGFKTGLITFSLLMSGYLVTANVITVKQDGTGNFTSIQTAYENANSGDTILVYPGTYFENLDIVSSQKDITIASLFFTTLDDTYLYNTIIDGNHNGTCIAIRNTNNADINIVGFTIENGSGYSNGGGGGLYIINANPNISDCIIQNNLCDGGGGFYCQSSTVNISKVTIRYNYAIRAGGGINCGYESSVIFDPINRCNIYLNYSGYGSDYFKTNYAPSQEIIVDTFTVLNPDFHFYYSVNEYELPVDDLELDILNQKIEPVNANLYVNPVEGNDSNDGLSPSGALKTIAYANKLIQPDSISPNNIFLSNGIYSHYTNNEKFPLNPRSFVSIIGASRDSTIFDLDSLSHFFHGYGLMRNFSLNNFTVINGYGNQNYIAYIGGAYIKWCNNVSIDNLLIKNCISSVYPGITAHNTSNLNIINTSLINNKGGSNLNIIYARDQQDVFSIINCIIDNAGPDSDPETGMGRGAQIGVYEYSDGSLKGNIINTQFTNNRFFLEDIWGSSGAPSALLIGKNTEVTLINATISGNVTENDNYGTAVSIACDSTIDIYNSIFYGDSIYELALGTSVPTDISPTVNVSYSNIEGGQGNVNNWYNLSTLNWLEGNIDSDPLWDTTSANPYNLLWNSPCIDMGVPMYEEGMQYPYIKTENGKLVLYKIDGDTVNIPSTDLSGNPRIVNGRIDMGAYEFQDTSTQIKEVFLHNIRNNIEVYPNPFYTNTFITFTLKQKAKVEVLIFDFQGNQIGKLMDARLSDGKYFLKWQGEDNFGTIVKSGTYVVSVYIEGQKAMGTKIIKK